MRRALGRVLTIVYGTGALIVFTLLFTCATLLTLVIPSLEWRRRLTHGLARTALPVLGIRLAVEGLANLPRESCIVVANHSSYVDGIVMKAALPPRFSFVIKREAASMPVAGFLLKRIGSEFVDRHDAGGRRRDALRVLRRAAAGHDLVFFPEGTFDEVAGLKRFHVGAFAAAVRGSMPVVPVVIHGARRALPSRAVIVRPGRVRVEILPSIVRPAADASSDVLRRDARRAIVARLDEPDLAPQQTHTG